MAATVSFQTCFILLILLKQALTVTLSTGFGSCGLYSYYVQLNCFRKHCIVNTNKHRVKADRSRIQNRACHSAISFGITLVIKPTVNVFTAHTLLLLSLHCQPSSLLQLLLSSTRQPQSNGLTFYSPGQTRVRAAVLSEEEEEQDVMSSPIIMWGNEAVFYVRD